jgi:hypothetical protein
MHGNQTPLSLLRQREIEARILKPVVDAMAAEFGREAVLRNLAQTIRQLAREHGESLAMQEGRSDMEAFRNVVSLWRRDNALELTVLQSDDRRYDFNVTRCRFAEMYRRLDMQDLGPILSCSRDECLCSGFNAKLTLTRTHTIMEGADHCDFRFHLQE